jgi:8-oxo-dGTP pyrophosphatase MutT (NUDIX family)
LASENSENLGAADQLIKEMYKKKGEWTIKSTVKKFENEFFSVYEDQVIRPDGKDGHYATIKFKEGVAVLPVTENGDVFLTEQFRYALGRKNLEVISGAIDGEDGEPLQAAKREAKEELGIEADEWIPLGKTQTDTSITNSTAHLFLARKLTFSEARPEGSEEIEPVKLKLADAVEKVVSGEISNGQTCVLVLKANELLKRE